MKKYLIDLYINYRTTWGNYHRQKEVSAWGALLLQIVLYGLVIRVNQDSILYHLLISVIIIGILILIILFIINQYKLKDKGSAYMAAASKLLLEIIQTEDDTGALEKYLETKESSDTEYLVSHFSPKILIENADILNTRGRGSQDKTRNLVMLISILFATFSLIEIWTVI